MAALSVVGAAVIGLVLGTLITIRSGRRSD